MEQQRFLLTDDKDFGELAFRLKRPIYGIILMRFADFDAALRHERLRKLFDEYGDRLYGRYAVVSEQRFRLRSIA